MCCLFFEDAIASVKKTIKILFNKKEKENREKVNNREIECIFLDHFLCIAYMQF